MTFCESCRKRPAELLVKMAVNNKVTERHLCQVCAAQAGVGTFNFDTGHVTMSELMGSMDGFFKELLPRERKALQCRACGLRYLEFKESGRLGCPQCYLEFEAQLMQLLTRIHGNYLHTGKRYAAGGGGVEKARDARELAELKKQLKAAVEAEDFEKAARLRDAIKGNDGQAD